MSVPLQHLVAEDYDESSGVDSAYDDDILSTASINSSVFAYEVENGRSYHAYNAGKYLMPNDEVCRPVSNSINLLKPWYPPQAEKDRMDIQYHALRILFDNKAFFAPIDPNPQRILDIGTGTGIWVMDVGDEYPSAQVIGTDLSPIQPGFVPTNVEFEVHDCSEYPWTYADNSTDLIHTRIMSAFAVKNWKEFFDESYKVLKPGGWMEAQEFDLMAFSDDDTLPEDSDVVKWCNLMVEGGAKGGMNLRLKSVDLKAAMEAAGFTEVTLLEIKLPIGLWPADPKLREAGKFALCAMLQGIEGVSLAIFTRFLGWSMEELQVFLVQVRNEWKKRKVHSYWPIYVVYGRKPLVESSE